MKDKRNKTNISIDNAFDKLIRHVNVIHKYIQSFWEMNSAPNILKIKYELGYDVGYELGFTNDDCDILFHNALTYLVNHENIILSSNRSDELRIYPPYLEKTKSMVK